MPKFAFSLLALLLFTPRTLSAFWPFGDSEAESEAALAERVSDLMRDPRRVIAEAQMAADDGNIEEAIARFREAQRMIEAIERQNDTSDSAFAALRLAKFHCISMLDDLVLRRAKVTDTRQAVTDTDALEAQLAKEREAQRAAEAADATEKPAAPPTLREQLTKLEAAEKDARSRWNEAAKAVEAAKAEKDAAQNAFLEAARAHTRADGLCMVARTKAKDADDEALLRAEADRNQAKARLTEAKERTAKSEALLAEAERKLAESQAALTQALTACDTVRDAIAREEAESKAREEAEKAKAEAERKRLEAEALLKRQKAAEAAAAARAIAEREAKRADAEKAKAREHRLAWCEEMWNRKDVDTLEQELSDILEEKPDEARALTLLAQLRLLQGRAADALDLTALVPAGGTAGLRAKMVAAGAYVALKRPFDAMRILEQAMKDDPAAPAPYLNMATLLMTLPAGSSNPEIAEQYYRKAVTLGAKRSLPLERKLGITERN